MAKLSTAVLVVCMLLAACSEVPYKRVYEGINTRNDAFKSPSERAMTPPPSYVAYQKECEQLKVRESITEKNDSPDFNLK